jgi:hypothetical protein
VEVLAIEDSWRWSFRFLKRLLEDDPQFHMTAFLLRPGGTYVQFAEPTRRASLAGFPQSMTELGGFDVMVLGDVDPRRWPAGLSAAIRDHVVDNGASLVFVAGPNLAGVLADPALASLLPVELSPGAARPIQGPIEVQLTRDAFQGSIFAPPTGHGRQWWSDLPAFDQAHPPVRKRPGASVLVEAVGRGNEYGRAIVVAEQRVGRGRSLFIGADTLWKWQMLGPRTQTGQTAHAVFWHQALRALSPVRPSDPAGGPRVTVDRTRYQSGDHVQVRVTSGQDTIAGATGRMTASVLSPSGDATPLTLVPATADGEDEGHLLRASLLVTEPGLWTLDVAVQGEGQRTSETRMVFDVAPGIEEKPGQGVNEAALHRLAHMTGGTVFQADALDRIGASIPARTIQTDDPVRWPLWDHFVLLLLLTACLATDWLLRLIRGYV